MKTKSGTNLVAYWRAEANKLGKNVYVGQRWLDGHVIGYGIWLYGPNETTKAQPPVASAIGLDELYGRT